MKRARGFTLVELAVVIAIIGVLLALLLPAVQSVREAARRNTCASNLKQIALAAQSYHETFKTFPLGNVVLTQGVCHGAALPGVGYPSEDGPNWLILLLPFVDQQAVYNTYDFQTFNESAQNVGVQQASVPTYACPSDQSTGQLTIPASGPAAALSLPYMPGSYRAMCGKSDGTVFLDSGAHPLNNYLPSWRGAIHTTGVAKLGAEQIASIIDGTSNTLMVGESTTMGGSNPSNVYYRTFWAYSYASFSLSSATAQARVMMPDFETCEAAGGVGAGAPCLRNWGSLHPGGFTFAFCDGAVRFLSSEIDLTLFGNMSTIAGLEVVQVPD